MGVRRVNAGVKIPPDLKKALMYQADAEGRTLSQLCERLLLWALEQVKITGNSINLQEFSIAFEQPTERPEISRHARENAKKVAERQAEMARRVTKTA